jgi:HAD superfamily hydrolase (TIGR01509 family)
VRALLDALAVDADPQLLVDGFWRHFEALRAELPEHGEIVYQELVAAMLAEAGVDTTDADLYEALRAEHRTWAPARELHPQSVELLETLRGDGLRIGLVSNAFDPGEFMRRISPLHGIADLIDAAVFSSEIGVRKPDPRIYRVVLDELVVEPERALFVGDRVLEDVQGPAALGMHTCLATYYRADEGIMASPARLRRSRSTWSASRGSRCGPRLTTPCRCRSVRIGEDRVRPGRNRVPRFNHQTVGRRLFFPRDRG